MGLSIVLFAAGVGILAFVIQRCGDPLDHLDTIINVFGIVVGVLLIATAFVVYPADEPFGGAPYPTTTTPRTITIDPSTPTTISLSATSTWRD